jgi:OmpA-OmpF porin, OOP family
MNSFTRQRLLSVLFALLLLPTFAVAQGVGRTYIDSRGKKIVFPLGDASFADEVVSFETGRPAPPDKRWADAKVALDSPNYDAKRVDARSPKNVVLGCGGMLVVRFVDNALVDVPGPDLYVFEVGPAIEAMRLAISLDGVIWTEVGKISGGTAEIDIAKVAKPGERYRYVRVTDLKSGCGGQYPGADIDAIGAIGSALAISFDASVLFEFDKFNLLPQAQSALVDAATRVAHFAGAAVTIEGHTDNVGAAEYNMKLSQARAESVRAFLLSRPELAGRVITAKGFGASKPVASNSNDDGRRKNRRVEIVINPSR